MASPAHVLKDLRVLCVKPTTMTAPPTPVRMEATALWVYTLGRFCISQARPNQPQGKLLLVPCTDVILKVICSGSGLQEYEVFGCMLCGWAHEGNRFTTTLLCPRIWWMATSVIVHQDGLGTDVRQRLMNAVPTLVRITALALWV